MKGTVQQWGNSLALRIPKPFAEETQLTRNSAVDLSVVNGNLVIRPLREPEEDLGTLLAKVTDENLHGEIDFGPPVGKEIW